MKMTLSQHTFSKAPSSLLALYPLPHSWAGTSNQDKIILNCTHPRTRQVKLPAGGPGSGPPSPRFGATLLYERTNWTPETSPFALLLPPQHIHWLLTSSSFLALHNHDTITMSSPSPLVPSLFGTSIYHFQSHQQP